METNIKVGDVFYNLESNTEHTVTKIGKKYIYVTAKGTYGKEYKCEIHNEHNYKSLIYRTDYGSTIYYTERDKNKELLRRQLMSDVNRIHRHFDYTYKFRDENLLELKGYLQDLVKVIEQIENM